MLKQYKDIYYVDWHVPDARAVMLMIHGMGASSGRYTYLAEALNKESISCYAIELPGFGELSGEAKGHIDSMKKYHLGINSLKELAVSENPGKPAFIIGESMGGVIITTHVMDYDPGFAGVIPVSPAYKDVMKISPLQRVGIFLRYLVNKKSPFKMPFKSEELTRDAEVLEKLRSDPREHRLATSGLLFGILVEMINIMMNIGKIKTPVLMLLSGKDYLADTNYSISLFKRIKADKKYILYPDSLHALTIEINREEIFSDIVNWIKQRI
jgi:alpha-beta hydrolase superfamily lysophospholipase